MRRVLFTIAAAVSMLLCVASAALWVRGYFVADMVSRKMDGSFDLPELHVTAVGGERGALVMVDQRITQGERNSQYIDLIPIRWKWQKMPPDPTYPAVTLTMVSAMRGTARRQFSFRFLGTNIAYRNQLPDPQGISERDLLLVIPHALVVGLTGMPPSVWIFNWRRRRRRAALMHLQPRHACGYSLVGNVSGVCPECGASLRLVAR